MTKKTILRVHGDDLVNLRASGITDATILANDIYTVRPGPGSRDKIAKILNRSRESSACRGGLAFPYRSLDGELNGFARLRPHHPRTTDKGKPIKYEQPVGEPLRAYFPMSSLGMLRDGKSPIFITEGEKKALALSQLGFAAIGLGGVWCFRKKGEDKLIDDLAAIDWRGRRVYIVFDYDKKPSTRRHVAAASQRLADILLRSGAHGSL